MPLSDHVTTLGRAMKARFGERVHKVTVNAGFTCPNRDGSKGIGGCTFCNNNSFSPNARNHDPVDQQVAEGAATIARRTRARLLMAYFQAYTNTYDDVEVLRERYDAALAQPGVIGLAIGTRPDCVPEPVLDLLAEYQANGHEIWLELGLQSAFDESLNRVNRGHGFEEYREAIRAAHVRDLQVCTHLILGLPGETPFHARTSLERVLELGVEGLKLHPLHVVKGTRLANDWRRGEYLPWTLEQYIRTAADLVELTPPEVVYHRLTGTASAQLLLAPEWCSHKWAVLNGIENELTRRGTRQGSALTRGFVNESQG
ncbi:MAG TPA: TIGR01212 family radical SAM protein [Gammaproteobacteria bacterium]|nr:TIGR01212 family radical SAM protein [Gammaproteobacteria bacterium]